MDVQNGNFDFGLWDNRNIPKEMPVDDQLEEDDGGTNSNKSVLAMPSYAKPDQISKTAAMPVSNPLNQTDIKEVNSNLGSIVRPQLPTNKSMSPIVKKMVEMDGFKRSKQEQYVANQEVNSDQNGNVQHRPPPPLDYFRNNVPAEQNNLEGNLEAPQFPDRKFRDVRSGMEYVPKDIKTLELESDDKRPLKEPVTQKVMAFNEVFNDNFVPSI